MAAKLKFTDPLPPALLRAKTKKKKFVVEGLNDEQAPLTSEVTELPPEIAEFSRKFHQRILSSPEKVARPSFLNKRGMFKKPPGVTVYPSTLWLAIYNFQFLGSHMHYIKFISVLNGLYRRQSSHQV